MVRLGQLVVAAATAAVLASCAGSLPPTSPSERAGSSAAATAAAPSVRPTSALNAETPPALPAHLEGQLSCATGVQPRTPDATGSSPYQNVAETSIELAFRRFLETDGSVVGHLPTGGWVTIESGTGWARFEHHVDGLTKAIALFSALPEGADTRWSWTVAACDPSEFDPAVGITGPVVIWTDAKGMRMPLDRVMERGLCGAHPGTIKVDGRVFAENASTYRSDRLRSTFMRHVRLPPDAIATPYRNGKRRIWIARDRTAAYVGATANVERWPRLVDDDDSVTDCN